MSNAYRYRKLEGHDYFRLLKISTTRSYISGSLQYHYSLVHTRKDDAPRYETLSYVWGTTVQDAKLTLLDGTFVRITQVLEVVLPKLVHHCETEYVWIDQICIDQNNVEERGHQISIMGNIYSNCVQVIVRLDVAGWLGEWLRSILKTAHRSLDKAISTPDLAALEAHMSSLENTVPYGAYSILRGFWLILVSDWFSRAWVFQEVVLAPKSKVIISGPSTHEETVTSLYELYWTYKAFLSSILSSSDGSIRQKSEIMLGGRVQILAEMYNKWSQRHFGQEAADNVYFARILSSVTSHARTSLELDKLYAFFGLNNRSSIVLRPDYELTFDQALVTTVVAIIKGTLRLDIFEFISIRYGPVSPSWVPNFRHRETGVPFRSTSAESKTHGVQDPTIQTGSGISYPWAGSCDAQQLRVHGKKIDTINCFLLPKHDLSRCRHTKLMVKSILNTIKDDTTHSLGDMSCIDRRILSALKADGWFDNTSDPLHALHAGSQVNPSIEHEHSDGSEIESEQEYRDCLELNFIRKTMFCRRLYTTKQALFASGRNLHKGDIICILHGCSHPVALRPTKDGTGRYNVRGTCYLEGWMDPWANGKIYWAEDEADEFVLV
ncbi:heterokaryon incompatibility protein-domain-containing protein [Paraphoma chrysanthemicola]|uniref:Heterokaryon incompatibility protein-domain-containing protein n=1 Tax=Paraphoma chrysanthemicola TaxID=798071 RepID=A0A8K0R427_9PLEO|nr:heterokaryon incompatibility protein-domain-containing protein [Paraphoma chrysanthemicola]